MKVSMESNVLVIKNGGKFGQDVLRAFEARRTPVRTTSPLARTSGNGRETVRFDYASPETYTAAFTGIERVLLGNLPAARDLPRLVFPAVDAALGAGVKYFIVQSRLGVERLPRSGEYLLERYLARTKIAVTFLRCGFSMQTVLTFHEQEMRQRGVLCAPLGNLRMAFVDRREMAEAAACALTEPGHCGRVYDLCGPQLLDYSELAQSLGEILHLPLRYFPQSAPLFLIRRVRNGAPLKDAWRVWRYYAAARRSMQGISEGDLEQILGRPPHTITQFLTERRRR